MQCFNKLSCNLRWLSRPIHKPHNKKVKSGFICRMTFLHFNNMVQVSSEYISIGCNKTAHAASWGNSGLVAFGADTLIALYSPLVTIHLSKKEI